MIAGAGLTLTAAGWRSSVAANEDALEARFAHQAAELTDSIQREFDRVAETVTVLGLISLDRDDRVPEPAEFRAVAQAMLGGRHGDSIQALEWVPRVPASERRSFEAQMSKQSGLDFTITSFNSDGEIGPAAVSDFYYPVTLIEPIGGNEAALGFDLGSNPAHRSLLEVARDWGRPAATGPIRLVQGQTSNQRGFLVFQALYAVEPPPTSVEARRESFVGFTLGVFRVADVVASTVRGLAPSSEIAIDIVDKSAPVGEQLVYARSAGVVDGVQLRSQETLDVSGRTWRMTLAATSAYGSAHTGLTWSILIVGIGITALSSAAGRSVVQRTRRDRAVIAERTLELEASEERYRGLFEGTSELIQSVFPDGSFAYVNPAWLAKFGYTADEVPKLTFLDIVHPDSLSHCEALLGELMETGHGQPLAATFAKRNGERVEVEGNIDVLCAGDQTIQTRTIFHDVTVQHRTLNELVELADTRQKFLATMSHELRTPLNGVLGFAQLMELSESEPLTERQLTHVRRITSSGRHLLSLIEDLLDIAKVDAGDFALTLESISPRQAIEEVAATLRPSAEARGLELRVSTGDLPERIEADRRSLQQVLTNLVGNAIKFTDQGVVEIRGRTVGNRLAIEVRDTGIGIPEADIDKIFEEFAQLDSGDTRRRMGAGLGLAISARLVKLHHGTIAVESVEGRGSTFTVTLPIAASQDRDVVQGTAVAEQIEG